MGQTAGPGAQLAAGQLVRRRGVTHWVSLARAGEAEPGAGAVHPDQVT